MSRPLCFVLMPFGKKSDPSGSTIDFDAVYQKMIKPAIHDAGLEPIRADEEQAGGIIHKPMFERLILCEYAVADLTTANANVFYEMGVRHAVRPRSTVLIFAERTRLPFDLMPMRGLPYRLTSSGEPADVEDGRRALAKSLEDAREATIDSPVYQLVEGFRPPDIARLKTDVFRERVAYSQSIKEQLREARLQDKTAVKQVEKSLGPLGDVEAGVVVDLMLSFRAVKAWEDMIGLVENMAEPVANTVLVQEQYAFALNRAGHGDKAESVLLELIRDRGPSSETYGILGRVYKDRWESAAKEGKAALAKGLLSKAIDAYLSGFEADWRDAYPGVNAVTLMELTEPPDPRGQSLLPVVTYAVERRIESGEPDYWDYATLAELAVLAKNEKVARSAVSDAVASVREVWEPETTLRNLRLIRKARENRREVEDWMLEVENALMEGATER